MHRRRFTIPESISLFKAFTIKNLCNLEHFSLFIQQQLCDTSEQEKHCTMTKETLLNAIDVEIKELIEELEALDAKEEDVQSPKSGIEQVEKGNLLRTIRLKRRQADKALEEKTKIRAKLQYGTSKTEKPEAVSTPEDTEKKPESQEDKGELKTENKDEYIRLRNIMGIISEEIDCKKNLVITAINLAADSLLTETEKIQNEVKIKKNVLNIHEQVITYKAHSNRVLAICNFDEVQYFTRAVSHVIDAGNEIRCIHDAYIERKKAIDHSSTINISSLVTEKFTPSGQDRFIRYNNFINHFKENVLTKNLKTSMKLEVLKQSLGGEAYDAIKLYTQGEQLLEALKVLDDRYARSEYIIAEIYNNLKKIKKCENFNNIKAAKDQISSIKIALATLKNLGYESELVSSSSLQQNFIMLELEAKIPREAYGKWTSEKERMKSNAKHPNLEEFCNFYENLVLQESDAQYVRHTMESLNTNIAKVSHDEAKKEKKKDLSATLLHTSTKEKKAKD